MDKVVHFEIPADDLGRAKKFYEKVFDWKAETYPGFEGYMGLHTVERDEKTMMPKEPGAINGGMMKRQAPIKNPVVTINVLDMDKANVGDIGIAAYFEDTESNVMGLWQEIKK